MVGFEQNDKYTGEHLLYICFSEYSIKNADNKEYVLKITDHLIWNKHYEYIGIGRLIIEDVENGKETIIGEFNYPYTDF